MTSRSDKSLLEELDLTEYETTALAELLRIGRTTAPNLAEATGIPKARIYGVLDSLAEDGYIKIVPGHPKEYQAKHPEAVVDRAVENRRQAYEQYRTDVEAAREEFLAEFAPIYESASDDITPTAELFHVVDVGDPSERETRSMYRDATDRVHVLTKSFEYFERIEPALEDALGRDVSVTVLFLHPDHLTPNNRSVQAEIIEHIRTEHPDVGMKYSNHVLPWRGTFVDPSMEYDSGRAILLVEEKDIPLSMRQAAITENGSFVAGLKRYFDLVWEHDSTHLAE
ncbi:MAG: TrmB family transcriptional regulator [Halobacteriales archaeon]